VKIQSYKFTADDSDMLKSDALVIYEKWFSLQATSPLNFSSRIRTKVEELICSGDVKCFDVPIKVVELFLDRNCLKKFIKSQLFFKHLSEVMNKVDQSGEQKSGIIRRNSSYIQSVNGNSNNNNSNSAKNKHRRTNSECIKISTQNTLLAGLDYSQKRKTDLQIDSRQILDPDMLWRRKNSTSKLSFGRIDAFGRFERDFEMPTNNNSQQMPLPQSKSFQGAIDVDDPQSIFEQARWSSLKNAMRKLVHLPEDSVQQEIAWQVAEMIIKDVTSITLPQGSESETMTNNS
jgi:A-kinase anchor protein 10